MLEKSQDYLRLAMAATAMLIGLSIAYHYVFYIPQRDRQNDVDAQSKADAITRESEAKADAAARLAQARRACQGERRPTP